MKKFLIVIVVLTIAMFGVDAMAGYMMKVDGDTFMTMGVKARIRWTMINPTPGSGVARRVDQTIPEGRIYAKGQITDTVKFFFNFDFTSSASFHDNIGFGDFALYDRPGGRLTDAAIVYDMAKEAKIQVGVYRMAVSRVALQDSYQYILITPPTVASPLAISNPTRTAPFRGEGATLWGDFAEGKLRYYLGAWVDSLPWVIEEPGGNNDADEIGLSGRVVFNFMDPEKGYACPGCYLGRAQVANIGLGYFTQDYNDGTDDKTYKVLTLDAFYDANGVTGEFGYFAYDTDQGAKPKGWYLEGAYAIEKWQFAARYESFDSDGGTGPDGDYTNGVLGINYFFAKQAAKLALEANMRDYDDSAATDFDTWTLQAQVQF